MNNILCHINHINKIFLFLLPSFPCSFLLHNWAYRVSLLACTFNAHWAPLLPVLHTVNITVHILFKPIILSNEGCGAKRCLHPVTKASSTLNWNSRYSHQYQRWVKLITKRKLYEIVNGYWESLSVCFHVPVNFTICHIIHNKCGVFIKWIVTVILYTVQVVRWRWLSSNLHCTYAGNYKLRNIQYCCSL